MDKEGTETAAKPIRIKVNRKVSVTREQKANM